MWSKVLQREIIRAESLHEKEIQRKRNEMDRERERDGEERRCEELAVWHLRCADL